MKIGSWSYLGLYISSIFAQHTIFDQDKPLHISVSINFASKSHIKYLLEILELVSQKGHRVTYLSTDQYKPWGDGYNVTHSSLGDVEFKNDDLGEMKPLTTKSNIFSVYDKLIPNLIKLYGDSFVKYEQFYKEDKPDLMICDFMASSCIESAARNSIPLMMGYQSLSFSTPAPYLTINGIFVPTSIEHYNFFQRFKHAIIDPIIVISNMIGIVKSIAPIREKYNVPKEYSFPVFGHMGLSIANSYIGLENPRKIPSHVSVIGPILSDHIVGLPEDLKLFLDEHPKVLYVAFGSMVHLRPELSKTLLQNFQRALNEGIVDGIIWGGLANTNLNDFPKTFTLDSKEYSTQSLIDSKHEKIKLLKWAPQEPILNHPNTKLFLSHGGLDSVYESLRAGTPMLILPFFADQPRNAMLLTENGVGDYIEWPTMSDEVIYQKFVKLLDSNNLQLQSKVRQLQLITKFSSNRKTMAADLIETYALSAISCRMFETAKPFESPCEMKPFLPLDYKMSSIKANLIDVYVVAILLIITIPLGLIYILVKSVGTLYKQTHKQKSE